MNTTAKPLVGSTTALTAPVLTAPREPAGPRIDAPSLVHLAAEEIRKMILSGRLAPGDRLIEERLTEELGISRPPLREALRLLQHEGLIETRPRRGSTVTILTDQDVFEILTLRSALERLAVELGIPVRDPARLAACRDALERMERDARDEDRGSLVEHAYVFHASIVALAGHGRLDDSYAAVQQQLMLCMARNLYTREHEFETLTQHVDRHRHLLDVIEAGDPDAVLAELAVHGERSFLKRSTTAATEGPPT
ncbi:GntR family transcriptional regulator [Cellulomonas aerilata]|uniref:GntR family transcriptional regulator n=1 Tax=Cellulomonas aerilata TaxID=515326 RepID=A0A512D8H5_9CELL|nr:GntR family transcriptional regulator [Cellulomonas aerilata]GEO32794.1 GntR family transcriptional regulator [Cellulomonas aerilata]